MAKIKYLDDVPPMLNTILDFIPIAGAVNRAIQGDYAMAATNAILDLAYPLKYIVKGRKLLKLAQMAPPVSMVSRLFAQQLPITKHNKKALAKAIHRSYVQSPLASDDYDGHMVDKREIIGNGLVNYANYKMSYLNEDDPGLGFLLTPKQQEEYMNKLGYKKVNDTDGIKKINKALQALKEATGKDVPMYQIGDDVVPRDSIIPIPYNELPDSIKYDRGISERLMSRDSTEHIARMLKNYPIFDYIYKSSPTGVRYIPKYRIMSNEYLRRHRLEQNNAQLIHAFAHPRIYYRHKNPNIKDLFYRDIDLNDYGDYGSSGTVYSNMQYLMNLYDRLGNPFIQRTGIQVLPFKYDRSIFND